MPRPFNNLYEFGTFRLDAENGTLWRGDEIVSIPPKAIEVLKLLVASNGQVVSKQDIFDSVWADTFVEDGVLTQNIYTLRHALGRDDDGKQFIETVPRRGYRFAGRVTTVPSDHSHSHAANGHPASRRSNGYDRVERHEEIRVNDAIVRSASNPDQFPPESASVPAVLVTSNWFLSRGLPFLAIAVVLLAATGFAVYRFFPRTEARPGNSAAPIEQIRFQSLTDTGDIIYPTISPNGEMLAFVKVEGDQSSVWVKQISTGSEIQTLPPTRKGYGSLTFSSDGQFLFFRDESDRGAIHRTSRLGGTTKKLADNVWGDFSVSPDNKRLAFIRRDPKSNAHLLVLANVDGGTERILGTRQLPNGYRSAAPAWSPDGKTVAVAAVSLEHGRLLLVEIDVKSGQETELETTPNVREIFRVLWTPDGEQLIIAARLASEATSQIWTIRRSDGELRRLTNDLEAYFWLSLSADGRSLVARQQRIIAHIWLLPDGDLENARQLTSGLRTLDGYGGLTWKPDGKIIFSSRSGDVTDLYSLDPESDERIQLTANTGADSTSPVVSPDARHVVFVSSRSGTRGVWRMDADGRDHKMLTADQTKSSAFAPTLSPDGAEIFFIKVGDGPSSIWKMPVDGGEAVPVSRLVHATAESFLSISPDGKWIAYQHVSEGQRKRSEDGATAQIGVIASDGSGDPRIFDVQLRRPVVHWTSDTTFDYASGSFNSSSLWRQSIDGDSKKLLDFPDRLFNFAWSKDGKDLVVSRGRLHGDAVLITNLP